MQILTSAALSIVPWLQDISVCVCVVVSNILSFFLSVCLSLTVFISVVCWAPFFGP